MNQIPNLISRGKRIGGDTTLVMGILNVTPDSFSDGGKWFTVKDAIARGMEMSEQGAAIVDVGGESTRPGAVRISAAEEWQRIGKVVEGLVREGVCVSVDTVNASTARAAADVGADLINDVSGGMNDSQMAQTCANAGVGLVVQHWRGFPSDPNLNQKYDDPVAEVTSELQNQVNLVQENGVLPSSIVVDPGLGFALGENDSWALVNSLDVLVNMGFPLLVGASRKRFVKARYGDDVERGTLDVTAKCVSAGVWGVRVHDVAQNVALIKELRSV